MHLLSHDPVLAALGGVAQKPAIKNKFCDLHGVKRGAFAQIVRDAPKGQSVFDRWIDAHAAHECCEIADAFNRRDIAAVFAFIDHQQPRRLAQDFTRLIVA